MKRLTSGVAMVGVPALAMSALLFGTACEPDNAVKPGSPELKMFQILAPVATAVTPPGNAAAAYDLLKPPAPDDAGAVAPPPGFPLQTFRAVFDRLLKAENLEDLNPDGGLPVGKADVATATWPGAMPPITLAIVYQPGGSTQPLTNPPGPHLYIRPLPSMPSASKVTIKLDKTKITGKAGEPMAGTDTFEITTDPFSATIGVPKLDPMTMMPVPVAGSFILKVTFNNNYGTNAMPNITVTSGGMPVPVDVKPDTAAATTKRAVIVEMKKAPMMAKAPDWPAGATLTVTVGPDADDVFGIKLGTAKSGMFAIKAAPPSDGGGGMDMGGSEGGGDGGMDGAGEGSGG